MVGLAIYLIIRFIRTSRILIKNVLVDRHLAVSQHIGAEKFRISLDN